MEDYISQMRRVLVEMFEEKLGHALTTDEQEGLSKVRSGMMLEAIESDLTEKRGTPEEVGKLLAEVKGMNA